MTNFLFITTSRADYGILSCLIKIFQKNNENYGILVTGTHLSQKYGYSLASIQSDNVNIVDVIDIGSGKIEIYDEIQNIYKFLPSSLEKIQPKVIIILGDRYEMIPVAHIANLMHIPIIHFHGGEITHGAFDESFRHSLTKLSHMHFTSHLEYKERVIQLGENPINVYNYGSLSVNDIVSTYATLKLSKQKYLSRKNIIIIYHPVTNEEDDFSIIDLVFLMQSLSNKTLYFFTPNNDPGRDEIYDDLKSIKNLELVDNLTRSEYLTLLSNAYFIIGNSSSGIIEAPAFRVPTINIGNRQSGRLTSASIINCANIREIADAIEIISSSNFIAKVISMEIPYYKVNGNYKIYLEIKNNFPKSTKKYFYDGVIK